VWVSVRARIYSACFFGRVTNLLATNKPESTCQLVVWTHSKIDWQSWDRNERASYRTHSGRLALMPHWKTLFLVWLHQVNYQVKTLSAQKNTAHIKDETRMLDYRATFWDISQYPESGKRTHISLCWYFLFRYRKELLYDETSILVVVGHAMGLRIPPKQDQQSKL